MAPDPSVNKNTPCLVKCLSRLKGRTATDTCNTSEALLKARSEAMVHGLHKPHVVYGSSVSFIKNGRGVLSSGRARELARLHRFVILQLL